MQKELADFVEQMGIVSEVNGLSRIAGRMIGLFLIDNHPHSLDEIVERLRVSKASVSTNARLLEFFGFLERYSKPGDRRDFYQLNETPWKNMHAVFRQRLVRTIEVFDKTLEDLPPDKNGTRKRLSLWRDYHAFVLDDFDNRHDRWEEVLQKLESIEKEDR